MNYLPTLHLAPIQKYIDILLTRIMEGWLLGVMNSVCFAAVPVEIHQSIFWWNPALVLIWWESLFLYDWYTKCSTYFVTNLTSWEISIHLWNNKHNLCHRPIYYLQEFPSSLFNISISLVLVLLLCDKNIQHTIYTCGKILIIQYSIIDYGIYDVGSLGLIHCA